MENDTWAAVLQARVGVSVDPVKGGLLCWRHPEAGQGSDHPPPDYIQRVQIFLQQEWQFLQCTSVGVGGAYTAL